jgi:hypothetical protein
MQDAARRRTSRLTRKKREEPDVSSNSSVHPNSETAGVEQPGPWEKRRDVGADKPTQMLNMQRGFRESILGERDRSTVERKAEDRKSARSPLEWRRLERD